jgi:hypothetical protein
VDFARAQRERFSGGDLIAEKVAGTGGENAIERATWTAVARAVINVQEMIVRQ